jgi:hypothetical protein
MVLKDLYEYTGTPTKEKIERFKSVFEEYGADKSSDRHNYHDVYAALFKDEDTVNDVLEVGVYQGASLRSWRKIFQGVDVVGLDNNQAFLFQEHNIRTLFVDQNSLPSFDYVYHILKGQRYEMIVDDGSHMWENIVDTLNKTFPKWLNIGGWYIVEDIKLQDEEKAVEFAKSLESMGHKVFLINMNDMVKDDIYGLYDNIVLAVQKQK